jgi:hypothetical protein
MVTGPIYIPWTPLTKVNQIPDQQVPLPTQENLGKIGEASNHYYYTRSIWWTKFSIAATSQPAWRKQRVKYPIMAYVVALSLYWRMDQPRGIVAKRSARTKIESRFLMFHARAPEGMHKVDDVRLANVQIIIQGQKVMQQLTLRAPLPI